MYDPNDIAAVALAQLAFPIVALLGSFRTPVKLVALGTVVSGVLLAFYTGSRGGLVGLVTFLVLFLGLRIPRVSGWRKLLLVLVLLSGVLVNIDKINVERYLTLSSVEEDYNATGEFGRKEVWQRGLQFFWDDPLTGVGVSRFAEAIGTMRAADGVQPRWQAAHNSYIEILAETGIVGGILFVLLVVRSLVTFWAAGRAPPATETAGAPPGDLQIAGALSLPACWRTA
jgi:O-antigen ligase